MTEQLVKYALTLAIRNLGHLPAYLWKLKAKDALAASSLEYTLVSIGFFLDYWSTPRIQTRIANAPPMFLDFGNRFASLPGDGSTKMVLTHSRDAGRFTVALLNVPRWETRYSIIGNRLSLKEAVENAEEVLGTSFEVHYDSITDLEEGKVTLTPGLESMVKGTPMEGPLRFLASNTGLLQYKGQMDLGLQNNLVEMFPNIKPLTVRDVAKAWR